MPTAPLTSETDYLYHYISNLPEEATTEEHYHNEDTSYRVVYTWAENGTYHSHALYPYLYTARLGIETRLNRHNRTNPNNPLNVEIKKVTITTEVETIPNQ